MALETLLGGAVRCDTFKRSLFEEIRRNQEQEREREIKLLQVHGTSKSVLAKL